jgi:transcriptional regulator with XRE-family HTH domain
MSGHLCQQLGWAGARASKARRSTQSKVMASVDKVTENTDLQALYLAVGKRVRDIRVRQGLTQKQLGEKSGIKHNYIGVIEAIGVNISLELLNRLSVALHVQIRDLMPSVSGNQDYKEKYLKAREQILKLAEDFARLSDSLNREEDGPDASMPAGEQKE